MILIDSHCHLDRLQNLPEIILRAKSNCVEFLQTISTKESDIEQLLNITNIYDNVFTSVGVHPFEISSNQVYNFLMKYIRYDKVIGIGETGLDFSYDDCNKSKQIKVFEEHIVASQNSNLPIIVHTRNAEHETIDILTKYMKQKNFSGLIHCFTGSKNFAKQVLDLGMYISISGIITFKNADNIRSVVESVPIEALLIETDSPYLSPEPKRGCINEPSFLKHIALFIAKLKLIDLDTVSNATTKNFLRLFNKSKNFITLI